MKKLIFLLMFISLPVQSADFDKTWASDADWNTPWTDTVGIGLCDTEDTFPYDTTNGNPSYSRLRHCVGRNDTSNRTIVWAGTWEDLGVTAGWTVSTVQMLDLDTKYLTDTVCDSVTFGPFELRDSGDVLVATLWTGRTATTVEGSFTAEGAQSAQSVGSLSASDANIELWMDGTGDTGNNASATCEAVFDNLDVRIVATEPSGIRRVIVIGTRFDRNGWEVKSKS